MYIEFLIRTVYSPHMLLVCACPGSVLLVPALLPDTEQTSAIAALMGSICITLLHTLWRRATDWWWSHSHRQPLWMGHVDQTFQSIYHYVGELQGQQVLSDPHLECNGSSPYSQSTCYNIYIFTHMYTFVWEACIVRCTLYVMQVLLVQITMHGRMCWMQLNILHPIHMYTLRCHHATCCHGYPTPTVWCVCKCVSVRI